MADVTLTYKGETIAELNDSGSKTIRTAGRFCEADIGVEYVKPSGGGGIDWDGYAVGTWPEGDVVLGQEITAIPQYKFYRQRAITSISAPYVTTIGECSFQDCSHLATVLFPALTAVPTAAFRALLAAELISLPSVTTISGSYTIGQCGQSTAEGCTLVLPSITTLSADCFRGNGGKYKCIDLGENLSMIPNRAFYMGKFYNIVLRKKDGIVAANSENALGKGAAGGLTSESTVWVPAALLSEYEAATNWASVRASTAEGGHQFSFAPIEGSIYEHAYADGTPIQTT